MLQQEILQENAVHNILVDFRIQTNHQIPARRLNLGSMNKNLEDFAFLIKHRVKFDIQSFLLILAPDFLQIAIQPQWQFEIILNA